MTLRAIAGLVALNAFVVAVGAGVLWGLRGWRSWGELLRLAGVAYLLGVAGLFIALTFELVVGIPVTAVTIALTGFALAGCGLAVGWRRGQTRPPLRLPGSGVPRLSFFGALFVAAMLVYLEAVFRAARLEWLWEFDAWRVWARSAKGIFFAGGIDPELAGIFAAYPPGVPALQAAAFHAMGSPDVATLHLEGWFLLAGFVAALAGLLAPRVRQAILLPFLLLLVLMPSFTERATWALADLPLDYLLAVAALLLLFWIEDRRGWRLAAATVLLGGALLTKREGLLLVVCVLAAAFAASWGERRWAWPRLAVSALVAFVLVLPWRIWILVHDVPGDGPQTGFLGFLRHGDRAWPSFELIVRTLFDRRLWLLLPALAVVSVVLAFLAGARRLAIFVSAFLGASVGAATWVIWANPTYEFTRPEGSSSVVRLVGGSVVVLGALTPLLLERALLRSGSAPRTASAFRRLAPWAIVIGAVLAYPGSMAVGYSGFRLPGGAPPFPSASDCVESPVEGDEVRVVFGYVDSYTDAFMLRDRALAAGIEGAGIAQDGCGRLRVFIGDIPSIAAAERIAAQARARQLEASLEQDPDG